jgi:hypothetical protein
MTKFFIIGVVALLCFSCYKTEYSGTLVEKGKVLESFYTPGQVTHTRTVTVGDPYSYGNNRRSTGVYYHDAVNEVPEKYGVMFECEHNVKFVIEGSGDRYRFLWQKMKKDSTVTILYREIYHIDTKTGQKTLFDYDFVDAK